MTHTGEILDFFTDNEGISLTTGDISKGTGIESTVVRVYVNRLKNRNKIKEVGRKGRSILYTRSESKPVDKKLLKELYETMLEYMIPKKKLPKEKLEIVDKIGEMFEK